MAVGEGQFQCDECGGIYDKTWSDDEAQEESVALFGALPRDELAVVCDDCFKAMGLG